LLVGISNQTILLGILEGKEGSQTQDNQANEGTNHTSGNGGNILSGNGLAASSAARSRLAVLGSQITLFSASSDSITTDDAG
jgi:hypothetical protein